MNWYYYLIFGVVGLLVILILWRTFFNIPLVPFLAPQSYVNDFLAPKAKQGILFKEPRQKYKKKISKKSEFSWHNKENYGVILIGDEKRHSKIYVSDDELLNVYFDLTHGIATNQNLAKQKLTRSEIDNEGNQIKVDYDKYPASVRWIYRKIDINDIMRNGGKIKYRYDITDDEFQETSPYFYTGKFLPDHMRGHKSYSRRMYAKKNFPIQLKPLYSQIKNAKKYNFIENKAIQEKNRHKFLDQGKYGRADDPEAHKDTYGVKRDFEKAMREYNLTGEELWKLHQITKGKYTEREQQQFFNEIAPRLNKRKSLKEYL